MAEKGTRWLAGMKTAPSPSSFHSNESNDAGAAAASAFVKSCGQDSWYSCSHWSSLLSWMLRWSWMRYEPSNEIIFFSFWFGGKIRAEKLYRISIELSFFPFEFFFWTRIFSIFECIHFLFPHAQNYWLSFLKSEIKSSFTVLVLNSQWKAKKWECSHRFISAS